MTCASIPAKNRRPCRVHAGNEKSVFLLIFQNRGEPRIFKGLAHRAQSQQGRDVKLHLLHPADAKGSEIEVRQGRPDGGREVGVS